MLQASLPGRPFMSQFLEVEKERGKLGSVPGPGRVDVSLEFPQAFSSRVEEQAATRSGRLFLRVYYSKFAFWKLRHKRPTRKGGLGHGCPPGSRFQKANLE